MAHDSLVRGLYRFQQRIGLTAPEFRAVLAFTGLLLSGSAVEHWRTRAAPVDPAVYAETDAYFRERAALAGLLPSSEPGAAPGLAASADTVRGRSPADSLRADSTVVEPPDALPAPAPDRGPIDVNTADAASLQRLPGIGPALAGRILEFRERNGPFRFVEDLLMVRGIGDRTLERIAPLVTVDGVPAPEPLP